MPCIPLPYISIWKWLGPWCSCVHAITSSRPAPLFVHSAALKIKGDTVSCKSSLVLCSHWKINPQRILGHGIMGARFGQSRSALGWGSDYSQGPGMTNIYITKGLYRELRNPNMQSDAEQTGTWEPAKILSVSNRDIQVHQQSLFTCRESRWICVSVAKSICLSFTIKLDNHKKRTLCFSLFWRLQADYTIYYIT